MKMTVSELNSLSDNDFQKVFANVVELHAEAAASVKEKRPFRNVTEIITEFHKYLDELNVESKLKILKLHPDLAGKLASLGELTVESTEEQRAAGLDRLTPDQKQILHQNNQRYKDKFGFPFIICAKENKIQSIIAGLKSRYNNAYDHEIDIGLTEVKKICKLRIQDIVKDEICLSNR